MRRYSSFLLIAIFSFILAGCESQTIIINSIPEREANEIVVLLNSRGIEAEKKAAPASATAAATTEQMWDIMVPAAQITEALAILNQAGLPRVKGRTLLDLFGSQGLVPSDMQDKIRYQEGLSAQLATTIRKMDGIIDANVQITFPQEDEEGKVPLTASVYVKHRGILDNPNSLTITKIKRLIASAVPGLTPDNVSVVTDRALYADITLQPLQELEEQRNFVSIWGVVVAKDSANTFRWIFYIFIVLLFIFACAVLWLLWKCLPVIQERGGFAKLFHPAQYKPGAIEEEVKEEVEESESELE